MTSSYSETDRAKRNRYTVRGADRAALINAHQNTCAYCGRASVALNANRDRLGPDGRTWNLDHVVPVTREGSWEADNLALACATCNGLKGNRTLAELPDHLRAVRDLIDLMLANAERWPTGAQY